MKTTDKSKLAIEEFETLLFAQYPHHGVIGTSQSTGGASFVFKMRESKVVCLCMFLWHQKLEEVRTGCFNVTPKQFLWYTCNTGLVTGIIFLS